MLLVIAYFKEEDLFSERKKSECSERREFKDFLDKKKVKYRRLNRW